MSAKWVRVKQWDDEHLRGWLLPLKWLLRVFSSISLAVVLLVLLGIYGVMASVPIGLLALAPTVAVQGATILLTMLVLAVAPVLLANRALAGGGVGPAPRFAALLPVFVGLVLAAGWAWHRWAWPALHYDPLTGAGLRFFPEFVQAYSSVTLRRIPGMEMSELEFYAWWPLNLILYLFVANMVVATIRRIEFRFENIGVLTVHSGIIVIALGSAYYALGKQEGDMLLLAGEPDASGRPTLGRPEAGFFDNTRTVLWVHQGRSWEQRSLLGIPRYNEYNLDVLGSVVGAAGSAAPTDQGRTLDLPIRSPRETGSTRSELVDADIRLRMVGYASYAELIERWRPIEGPAPAGAPPMRIVEIVTRVPAAGDPTTPGPESAIPVPLVAGVPAERLGKLADVLAIEYTQAMPETRWQELQAVLPADPRLNGARPLHGLVVEIPGQKIARTYSVDPAPDGSPRVIEVGSPAWKIEVRTLAQQPPFPIITPGYEGAESSVAIVRVTPPAGPDGKPGVPFERYVYHRFPELAQDLSDERNSAGMPKRSAATSDIRLAYIDASRVQIYLDETRGPEGPGAEGAGPGSKARLRAIVRLPGSDPQVLPDVADGARIDVLPMISVRPGQRFPAVERVRVPVVTPTLERDTDNVGNHRRAALAIEVSVGEGGSAWRRVMWLPFRQYFGGTMGEAQQVALPDGRTVAVAFGRRWWPLPRMALALRDFEMIPYPHSTQPQDYRSDVAVLVMKRDDTMEQLDRSTSLNAPLLQSPFLWDPAAPWIQNAVGSVLARLGPTQFKFSQTGWDSGGWTETAERAARGELPRAYARFTILGVGNNPGIHVIAFGAILMSLGIPWAFYIKPWILRRRKRAIQKALAEGTYVRPGAAAPAMAAVVVQNASVQTVLARSAEVK